MIWEADSYLESLYAANKPVCAFNSKSRDEWLSWRQNLQKAFINDLGDFPDTKEELNPQLLERQEHETYVRKRISICTDKNLSLPAYLLIPKNRSKSRNGKLPAVIACHGHGYGSRSVIGLKPDGTPELVNEGYQKNFGLELVQRGYIVIVPELFGFGDRRMSEDSDKDMNYSSCHRISTFLLMLGKTIAGVRVWDIIRTVDYLLTRDEVDPERIGCMGISGGGLVCSFVTAVDERIKVSVVSGYTNTFKDSIMSIAHCVDNFVPGLLKHAEMPDIIGLIAPRPLLIEAGTQDEIFPINAVKKAYSALQEIYAVADAKDMLDADIFEGEHQISGAKAYDWFERWL